MKTMDADTGQARSSPVVEFKLQSQVLTPDLRPMSIYDNLRLQEARPSDQALRGHLDLDGFFSCEIPVRGRPRNRLTSGAAKDARA
jgi:hypothetical protein